MAHFGSQMVLAIEDLWKQIQEHNPQVPDVVVTTGSGIVGFSNPRWGHAHKGTWSETGEVVGSENNIGTLFIGGECFSDAEQTLNTALHEAAHHVNYSRGENGTSNGGRYHNKTFKAAAEELGLTCERVGNYAWAETHLAQGTFEKYNLDKVKDLVSINWMLPLSSPKKGTHKLEFEEDDTEDKPKKKGGYIKATCRCESVVRMSKKVYDTNAVRCDDCDSLFIAEGE